MIRRRTALVAAAVLAAGALTSCGSDDAAGGGQSVTMWIYPVIADEAAHKKFWDDEVAEFKKTNADIDVKVEIYPWAKRDEALATAIASNTAPDVVYLIPDQLPGYAKSIEPMDSHLSDAAKADYFDNVKTAVTSDGKMLGAPILTSALPFLCDKRAFDAVGETKYPTTWEELEALGPAFKAKGYQLIDYQGSPEMTLNISFYPLLWQAGGDVFDADGKTPAFNKEPGVKALTWLKKMVDAGYVSKDTLTANVPLEQSAIGKGKVACSWHFAPSQLADLWGKENIVVNPPLKETKQVAYGTVGSLAMLKTAKNKDAAAKWIEFASGADSLKKYDTASAFFSPKKSTGELYPDDKLQSATEKIVPLTTPGPLNPQARQLMGVLAPEIQAALLGQKSPQQALDDAAKAASQLPAG